MQDYLVSGNTSTSTTSTISLFKTLDKNNNDNSSETKSSAFLHTDTSKISEQAALKVKDNHVDKIKNK